MYLYTQIALYRIYGALVPYAIFGCWNLKSKWSQAIGRWLLIACYLYVSCATVTDITMVYWSALYFAYGLATGYVIVMSWRPNFEHRRLVMIWLFAAPIAGLIWYWFGTRWDWNDVLFGLFVAFLVFTDPEANSEGRRVRLFWFVALPVLVFVAFYQGGFLSWFFVYYARFGLEGLDGDIEAHTLWSATGAAMIASAAVFGRLAFGHAPGRYRWVMLFGSIALLCLVSTRRALTFVSQIDGSTARSAAEKFFAHDSLPSDYFIYPPRIEEEEIPADFGRSPEESVRSNEAKRFVLYYGPDKVHYVYVVPYRGWWWKILYGDTLLRSPHAIDVAEWYMATGKQREATVMLEAIIRDSPSSEASRRAEALLQELQSRPKEE